MDSIGNERPAHWAGGDDSPLEAGPAADSGACDRSSLDRHEILQEVVDEKFQAAASWDLIPSMN
jgi:hypothetical protein